VRIAWLGDRVENGRGVGSGRGRGYDLVPGDVDGDVAEGPEGADEFADADPGDLLQVSGDGQRGEHDREVCLDRVVLVMEHRPRAEVGLGHSEGSFDLE